MILARFIKSFYLWGVMRYKNLTLIGTSHIAKQSVLQVKDIILKKDPDIIAIELDRKRFFALLHKKRGINLADIKKIGVKGFLFQLIGALVEAKLGKIVGVKPGSEMILAIKLAKEKKKRIALIDQDIEITLRRFSQEFSFKEKINFIIDIISAPFKRKKIPFDLTKVPSRSVINELIKDVKSRYPNVYKVLIKERNDVMARNFYNIMKKHHDKIILGIIGAGHEEEMINLIRKVFKEKKHSE